MPYAPGIAYRGDQYIAQGNAAGLQALGTGIATAINDQKKLREADAVAQAMYKYLTPEEGIDGSKPIHPLGDPDSWRNKSAQERAAATSAYVQSETLKQAIEEHKAQNEERQARTAALKQQLAGDEALQGAIGEMGAMAPQETLALGQGPIRPPAVAPTAERLLQAISRHPAASSSRNFANVDNLLRAMQLGQGQETPGSYTVPETGAVFATLGKTMLPAGMKQPAGGAVQSMISPDGELLGFIHRDAKGHETIIKPPASAKLRQARDESGAPLPGLYVDGAGKPHDLRSQMQKLGLPEAPTQKAQDSWWSGIFGGSKGDQTPASPTVGAGEKFSDEAAARKAGKKTGDTVYLNGIGKVRLK